MRLNNAAYVFPKTHIPHPKLADIGKFCYIYTPNHN